MTLACGEISDSGVGKVRRNESGRQPRQHHIGRLCSRGGVPNRHEEFDGFTRKVGEARGGEGDFEQGQARWLG